MHTVDAPSLARVQAAWRELFSPAKAGVDLWMGMDGGAKEKHREALREKEAQFAAVWEETKDALQKILRRGDAIFNRSKGVQKKVGKSTDKQLAHRHFMSVQLKKKLPAKSVHVCARMHCAWCGKKFSNKWIFEL